MKNGTTPIGFTMASNAISGFSNSMGACYDASLIASGRVYGYDRRQQNNTIAFTALRPLAGYPDNGLRVYARVSDAPPSPEWFSLG